MNILLFVLILYSSTALSNDSFEFTVLHTNDLHSYFEGSGPDMDFTAKVGDGDIVKGHYSRLAFKIKEERKKSHSPLLLLDAGDYFAGTLFHALGPNRKIGSFPEAEFFKLLNYDATTFGNHEFDARDLGLEIMLTKWIEQGVQTPIVATNAFFHNKNSPLKKFIGPNKPIKRHLVKEVVFKGKTLRIGIIGLLGPDGALVSLGSRRDVGFIGFEDKKSKKDMDKLVDYLRPIVIDLKKSQKVDLVIGLMHGGHPEDIELLEGIPEINLLIAGHTHKVYPKPIKVGKSLLVQAGCFGQFLGKLKLNWDGVKLSYTNSDTIIEINDDIPVDNSMQLSISNYKNDLNSFLQGTGFVYDSFIFEAKKDYVRRKESINELGVLVTSAVREELNKVSSDPIGVYFTSIGLIRKNITNKHRYQLSDIFKILAIGFDENLNPGAKVVSFYLSKEEVYDLINFLEVYGMISHKFTPAFSETIHYENRWWGIPFLNKLKNLTFKGKPYDEWPELIHVSTSQFVAAYLPKVQAMSYGMLEFIPKDKAGNKMNSPFVHESKEYVLLAKYLKGQN